MAHSSPEPAAGLWGDKRQDAASTLAGGVGSQAGCPCHFAFWEIGGQESPPSFVLVGGGQECPPFLEVTGRMPVPLCFRLGAAVGGGGEVLFHACVEGLIELLFHGFEEGWAGVAAGAGGFGFEALVELVFHLDERVEEGLGGAGLFDAVGEGVIEVAAAGAEGDAAVFEFGEEVLVGVAEAVVVGFEGHFVAIDECVVGAWGAEEFDDEGDGVDEHEEECEDRVGGEGEAGAGVLGVEEPVEGEGLGEDVAAGFGAEGGGAGGEGCGGGGDVVLGAFEVGEERVDLLADGGADAVLLGDELGGLVLLDAAAEVGDAFGFLGIFGGVGGETDFEGVGGGLHGVVDAGIEAGFFCAGGVEESAEAFYFGAAPVELVGADGFGARAFASHAGALAVEFAFEFGLPEGEFGLEFGVGWGEFGDLGFDGGETGAEGGGGFVDGFFEIGLLFRGEASGWGVGGSGFGGEEFGFEAIVPFLLLGGDFGFDGIGGGGEADVSKLMFFGDGGEVGVAFAFDDGGDGVAEEEEDERVGDG